MDLFQDGKPEARAMLNKLIFSVLFLLFLLGVLIYFRTEFKYTTMAKSHATGLGTKMQNAGTAAEIVETVEKNKGVSFASDFILGEKKLARLCNSDCLNSADYYAAYGRLVDNIKPEKLWAFKENKFGDSATKFILQQEKRKLESELYKNRMYFSDNYKSVTSDSLKEELLNMVKKLDSKIEELKK
jgi:hypothetical protein